MTEYACEQPDVLNKIENSAGYMYEFLDHQISNVCLSGSSLRASLSRYNVQEAHGLFSKDIDRLTRIENGGKPLEQYKRIAFLVYWIRRLSPISAILSPVEILKIEKITEKQKFIALYANEYCSFDIGYRLGRYVASRNKELENPTFREILLALNPHSTISLQDIRYYNLTPKHIHDVCAMLKEKNVSPHSLYLLYSSYFNLPTIRQDAQ